MVLNVPVLSQRDTRWANQRLGTVDGSTIGDYGCIITCMAMLANYYNHPITVNVEDDWLTNNQGYVQGNLYRNDAFPREFPDCSFDSVISCTNTPAPMDKIDAYLNAGKPVVVMVDFDHNAGNGIQTHFVLLVGKADNGQYICNDPWTGDQINFDQKYGKADVAINQINFFSGPVPIQATQNNVPSNTPVITDQTKIPQIDNLEVQAIRSERNDLKSSLLNASNTIQGLQQELNAQNATITDLRNRTVTTPGIAVLIDQIKAIIYGRGWPWSKVSSLKQLLPQ